MSPTPKKPAPRRKAPTTARKAVAPAPDVAARPADASTSAERVLAFLLKGLPAARREKIHAYLVLTRMDRPIGALLLLWPTWWALWLAAKDFPPVGPLIIFTLGVFAMRSAGCAINDYADRKLDPQVARTAGRPIASGRVTPREALCVFAGLLVFSFVLVLFTNTLTILLSFAGAALAAVYPFSKRYTNLPQVVLGAAFGWSIPMAFAAVTDTVPPVAWLLFIANIIWSVIYDTEYAMVDREDDIKAGAKSTAILFADADLVIIGILMGTFLLAMLLVGTRSGLGWPYWLALAATTGLFAWQQWIMRDRDRQACLTAFRQNNWVGLALWVGIVVALAL
ncbi:4-hydroxybenzoate octaprenyltransferase [Dyella sp. 333MFSha]|uniref:4-hydroxybenzoate octaprenyltransferase n=1 Tax=Dyella sp. 333MFSha TaxID=1798240 RepID=UPI000885B338|nr:4-hydroxybenzoate octaprenyltransferase [Dyella sp. 333MFSha]SDG95461.1 4-hydroxybenzoate polyprenyltransferase [Dyella sp. 333MFSha]